MHRSSDPVLRMVADFLRICANARLGLDPDYGPHDTTEVHQRSEFFTAFCVNAAEGRLQ
jgi:hypothetical protein